jgi:hypothetical protein
MEEYEKNNEPQGELFNEIYKENLSPQGGSGRFETKRPFRISFDKFIFFLIFMIIIGSVSYIFGFRQGNNADTKVSELVSTEHYIVIDDEQDLIAEMREELQDNPLAQERSSEESSAVQSAETSSEGQDSSGSFFSAANENKNWTIQLVTYTSEKYSHNEMDRLKESGYEPFLIPSGKFYQVCVNRFSTKEEANKLLQVFKSGSRYRDAFLRNIKR